MFGNGTPKTEYAGVFEGSISPATTQAVDYNFFCSELNHNINIGSIYDFNVYNSYLAAPIQDGRVSTRDNPISIEQKAMVDRLLTHCVGLSAVQGYVVTPATAQDLVGNLHDYKMHLYDATQNPIGMTHDHAAAVQILIWEIIHEPWSGVSGLSLDSGDLKWKQENGTEFGSAFKQDFQSLAYCAVPEASTLAFGLLGVAPMLMVRRRARIGA